jgi:hypothetical protein
MEMADQTLDGMLSADTLRKRAQISNDPKDDPGYRIFRLDFSNWEGDGRKGIPFDDTTMFYENISTELGRYQMSTFPMARALCNAMVLAGFRAEMDGGGDIWFEDDDGDAYYDAREYQPGQDEDDGVVANCPICRNPKQYGLSYIHHRAEAGVRYIQEFREARKRKGKEKGCHF